MKVNLRLLIVNCFIFTSFTFKSTANASAETVNILGKVTMNATSKSGKVGQIAFLESVFLSKSLEKEAPIVCCYPGPLVHEAKFVITVDDIIEYRKDAFVPRFVDATNVGMILYFKKMDSGHDLTYVLKTQFLPTTSDSFKKGEFNRNLTSNEIHFQYDQQAGLVEFEHELKIVVPGFKVLKDRPGDFKYENSHLEPWVNVDVEFTLHKVELLK